MLERSHSINLNLEIYDAPVVNIFGVAHNRIAFDDRLSLNVSVTSLLGNPILGVNVSFYPPIDMNNVQVTRTYGIEVKAGTFQVGVVYNVTVTAEDRNGIGSASLPISINEPPLGGTVDLSLIAEDDLVKNISLSFSLWEDDYLDYPLSYNVGYSRYNGQNKVVVPLLLQPVLSHQFEFTVPAFAQSLNLAVCDTYGACTEKELDVPGTKRILSLFKSIQTDTVKNVTILLNMIDEHVKYGNTERILSDTQLAIQLLNEEDALVSNSTERLDLRSKLTQHVLDLPVSLYSAQSFSRIVHDLVTFPNEIPDNIKLQLVLRIKEYVNFFVNDLNWNQKKENMFSLFVDSLSYLRDVTNLDQYGPSVSQEAVNVELLIAQSMLTPKLFGSSPIFLDTRETFIFTAKDTSEFLPTFYHYANTSSLVPRRLLRAAKKEFLDSIFIVYSSRLVRGYSNISSEQTSTISSLLVRDSANRVLIDPSFEPTIDQFNFTETFVPLSEVRIESGFDNLFAARSSSFFNHSVQYGEVRCAVWNETLSRWSEDNCFVVTSKTTPSRTFCQCDSFGQYAAFQSSVNTTKEPNPPGITQSIVTGKEAVLIAIVGGIGLFIVVALIPLKLLLDKRRQKSKQTGSFVPIASFSASDFDTHDRHDIPGQTRNHHQINLFVDSDLPVVSGEFTDFEASDY